MFPVMIMICINLNIQFINEKENLDWIQISLFVRGDEILDDN